MDYGGLNAKIKAMKGHLFNHGNYSELSALKSVDEIGRFLTASPSYGSAFAGFGDRLLTRHDIEDKILISLSVEFKRIYNFISDFNVRRFLDAFFLSHEINLLKQLLCLVYDKQPITYSLSELGTLFGYLKGIDIEKLKASKDVFEFVESLRHTEFYSMLANVYTEGASVFNLEMQLDLYYYMRLSKFSKMHLFGENKLVMDRVVGVEVDLRNIMWIYRFKNFYDIDRGRIYSYLVPINYRLNPGDITRLVECKSSEQLLATLNDTYYKNLCGAGDAPLNIERICRDKMRRVYTETKIMHPHSLAVAAEYLFLKDLEIKNIITLLEGVRYKLDAKEILASLDFSSETEAG